MTPTAFSQSLEKAAPPHGLSPPLQALWWAAKGKWDRAHKIVQDDESADAAWVHAYLHRVEGDLGNAAYWYRRAKQSPSAGVLGAEWKAIAETLLKARD